MDVLKTDNRAVVIAAARAQKAADYILGAQQQEEARQRSGLIASPRHRLQTLN